LAAARDDAGRTALDLACSGGRVAVSEELARFAGGDAREAAGCCDAAAGGCGDAGDLASNN
jgi:hypothetical protein